MSLWQLWEPCGNFAWEPCRNLRHGNLGNLGNLHLGTLGIFTLEILGPCTWQLGNLYLGTFWALQESVLGNLGDLHLGAFTRNCCGNLHSVTLATLGALWNLYLGTLREPLPWEPWKPVLGNLYLGTLETFAWELLLGNLVDTSTSEPLCWNPANLYLGTVRAFLKTWTCKPCENQYHVTFGTLGTLGTFTRNCCGNLHRRTLATLGALWNLYLGTLWEPLPWEPCWRPCTNLYSATFPWEPFTREFYGNVYLGALDTFI